MSDIAVIGAGIVGATCAWVFAREGAKVTLIDSGGETVSDGSLAWLNASSTADPAYATIRAASVRLWRQLAEEPGCPVVFNGSLMWGEDLAAVDRQVEIMADVGWRSIAMDKEEIEAAVDGMTAPDKALFSPDEGYADPAEVTKWMRGKAMSAGAEFQRRMISTLDEIEAEHILVCAGNGASDLLPGLPLRRSPGIVMRTAPIKVVIPCVMASPQLDVWQGTDGVIVMSSSLSKTPERADKMMAADALSALNALFPGIDAEVISTIRRDRPIPEDGYPLVGRWGKHWVAAMHSGMTLAPVMAEALADAILGRPARFDISAYRPDRAMTAQEETAL